MSPTSYQTAPPRGEDDILHGGSTVHHGPTPAGRFAERALSAAVTCRMQRRSLFTYLSELIAAHTRGDPFPALTC